ncbi:hypothetical protein V8E53_002681 [Lactarius tabidus]
MCGCCDDTTANATCDFWPPHRALMDCSQPRNSEDARALVVCLLYLSWEQPSLHGVARGNHRIAWIGSPTWSRVDRQSSIHTVTTRCDQRERPYRVDFPAQIDRKSRVKAHVKMDTAQRTIFVATYPNVTPEGQSKGEVFSVSGIDVRNSTHVRSRFHALEILCYGYEELRKLRCSIETSGQLLQRLKPTALLENLNPGLCPGSTFGVVLPTVDESL